ncbi:hypothetical protein KAR91_76565, partial [Candidatus Pacearchaeota archaeon]|nr:hypothetical protein [Candidatus Pacearchaeota archaeon]
NGTSNIGGVGGTAIVRAGEGGQSSETGGKGGDAQLLGGLGGLGGATGEVSGAGGDVVILGGSKGGSGPGGTPGDGGHVYIDSGDGDTIGSIYLGNTRGPVHIRQATTIGSIASHVAISATGNLTFVGGGSGLDYGYCYGDHIAWTQAAAAENVWYMVDDADMISGVLNNVSHDGSGKLEVAVAGDYLVSFDISYEVNASNIHIEFSVEIDEANPAVDSPHTHTTSKFANQEQASSASGMITLAAGEEIQVSVRTTGVSTPTISVHDVHLNCVQVGG